MAYEKLQGYLALEALASDDANIPYPAVLMTGETDTIVGEASQMEDANGGFETTNKVYSGDIVYFPVSGKAATVIKVNSDTELLLNDTAGQAGDQVYIIYQASSYLNLQDANNGCVLYVGGSGDLKVDTISGSTVTFKAVPIGFFPVQVKKIYETGTTASSIIALW